MLFEKEGNHLKESCEDQDMHNSTVPELSLIECLDVSKPTSLETWYKEGFAIDGAGNISSIHACEREQPA